MLRPVTLEPVLRALSRASSTPSKLYDPTSLPNRATPNMVKLAPLLVLIVACGFPRPERLPDLMDAPVAPDPKSCADDACTDPAYPFCDMGGEIGGAPMTCIAVTCTPGEFAACRGSDAEFACNSTATGYDLVQCPKGCDTATGCRLCEPNQTVCTNGTTQTCDANGSVASSEACALGCFEDQPRCRELSPSNGLTPYMDMAAAGPDLIMQDATLSVPSGVITAADGVRTNLHSVIVTTPQNPIPIQAFPVRSLSMSGITTVLSDGTGVIPAVAFVVYRDVRIDGTVVLAPSAFRPPGAISSGDCVGSVGTFDVSGVGYFVGGGGGGGANRGGDGGAQAVPAFRGGVAFPNPDLQPLRGGCAGGTPDQFAPAFGGGAIQITSRSIIRLGVDSGIEANGVIGFAGTPTGQLPGDESIPGGGGAGGGILLEAPQVILASRATITANGGAGTSGDGHAGTPASGRLPSLGGNCIPAADTCTRGGHGGSVNGPDTNAPSITFTGQQQLNTGAGGGSIGYIRINTSSGVYMKANDVFESPIPSTGNIVTR
jgi:hypothetical protein